MTAPAGSHKLVTNPLTTYNSPRATTTGCGTLHVLKLDDQRRVVELRDSDGLASETVLRYLNRASDLAFALARAADEENPEIFEGREGSE